jgi:hypothetical protein
MPRGVLFAGRAWTGGRVLHFEPIRRAAGTVGGILALRHDAFEAELAGMGEDDWVVAFDMLVKPDRGLFPGLIKRMGSAGNSPRRLKGPAGQWTSRFTLQSHPWPPQQWQACRYLISWLPHLAASMISASVVGQCQCVRRFTHLKMTHP